MGKLGAIISQVGFFQLKDIGGKNAKIPLILQIFSGFMFIGLLFTWFVPETKGKTLEELGGDSEDSEADSTSSATSSEFSSQNDQVDTIANEKNDQLLTKF
jgi:hypothetical protein